MNQKNVVIRKKQLALVVSAACMAMGSASALAVCSPTITVNSGISYGQVDLLCPGQSIIVATGSGIDGAEGGIGVNASGVAAGSINNSGTITGSNFGINVDTGSVTSIFNVSGGIISGNNAGISIGTDGSVTSIFNVSSRITSANGPGIRILHGSADSINNYGTIEAAQGHGIDASSATISGSITNNSSGSIISGSSGSIISGINGINIYESQVAGVTNLGHISAYGGAGIYIEDSTIGGNVRNGSGGVIESHGPGMYVTNSTVYGGVLNDGVISSHYIGVDVTSSVIGGDVRNGSTGVIESYGTGMYVSNSTVYGGILNDGVISSHNTGVEIANSIVNGSVRNTGTIHGGVESYGGGISLWNTVVTGEIVNTGTIDAHNDSWSGYSALAMSGGSADRIVNGSGGVLSSASGSGIYLDTYGFYNEDLDTYGSSGTVLHRGILNQGEITGGQYGIEMYNSSIEQGGIVNDDRAVINGGILGVNTQIGDGITNRGTINASTFDGGEGGGGNGIALYNSVVTGDIRNSGTITGAVVQQRAPFPLFARSVASVSQFNSNGIMLYNTAVSGDIVNDGTITAPNAGIIMMGDASVGSIINNKTIAGGTGAGIAIWGSTVNGAINNSGTISGTKAIDIFEPGKAVTINNSGLLDGAVSIANGVLNLDGKTGRVTGAVDGTGAVNVNGTFTSENTFDVGSFNIAQGGLFNAGHAVTASSGMTNSGTLSVLAIHPFTMTGDYTQATSGVYHIDANSMTSYGQMTVTGTATLAPKANIDVDVTGVERLTPNGTLAGVIKAGKLDASTFNVTDNSALFNFEGVVNGNNVDLTVRSAATVYNSTMENRNFPGGNAAQVLDWLFQNSSNADSDVGNVMTAFGRLSTTQEVSDAVSQTLPLFTGAAASASSGAVSTTGRIVQARQDTNLGLSAGDGFITDRQIWAKPFGSWAKQGNRDGVFGYSASTGGVVFGADGVVSKDDRIGAAFAYANTSVDGNNDSAPQSAKVNTYMAMLYGSHSLDQRTDLSWQAEIGSNQVDAGRTINFGGLERRASSSFRGVNAHLGLSLGRVLEVNETTNVVPSIRLDYTMIKNNGYTETGAGALNLNVADQRTQSMVISTDGKLVHKLSDKSTFTANLGVGYDLMSKQNSITAAYVGGGAAFSTAGIEPSAWSVRGGAGMILHAATGMEITARYDVDAQRSFTNQTVSVKLRKAF